MHLQLLSEVLYYIVGTLSSFVISACSCRDVHDIVCRCALRFPCENLCLLVSMLNLHPLSARPALGMWFESLQCDQSCKSCLTQACSSQVKQWPVQNYALHITGMHQILHRCKRIAGSPSVSISIELSQYNLYCCLLPAVP